MTAPVLDRIPPDVAAPAPTRPRVVMIGTALVSAAVLALFAGMFAIYFNQRSATIAGGEEWIPGGAGTIPLTPASVMFVTLGMSMITVQWSVYAIGNDDRRNTYISLGLTLVFGAAFLNQAAFMFSEMGWVIADSIQAVLIYAITGGHVVMMVVAMAFVTLMGVRALGGQFNARDHEGISAAALFWHASVVVYAVIWAGIYQVK
ncbi:MAG TPA: cytochrome c oxidase subunit 3 [Acidimicrobiales bacterium]|nr:cytochrome c oxidase subunit 3 [Acidimicrobiales bacterium]